MTGNRDSHVENSNNSNNNPTSRITTDDSDSEGKKREKFSGECASTSIWGNMGARTEH